MIGTVLLDHYRLDAELGRGGMSLVYRGQDLRLGRPVAVKMLAAGASGLGTAGQARLLTEARAVARLNHPNIVTVYDAGIIPTPDGAGTTAFIVMEYVEGESLYARPPRALADLLTAAVQICAALEHAHAAGIIHRDLKPENVLLTPTGSVKLMDFGLAHTPGAPRLTEEGTLLGTFAYLAPELITGGAPSAQSDLYALGVMLYELTTGRPPFTGENMLLVLSQHVHATVAPPSTYNPELPAALETLILQLLSKQPGDRPRSAADVRAALRALQLGQPAPSGGPAPATALLDRIVRGHLVGRDRELAAARVQWQRAAAGEAGVLLVSGEPGIGKTRLVRELATLAEVARATVLSGECYAEGGAPYAPIAQLVYAAVETPGFAELALPSLVLADLVTLAPGLRARYPELAPNLALEPAAEQQRLFESFAAVASALAGRAPLLLAVDDLHWADSGSLYLLRHLARRARTARWPLLLCLTYREVELDEAGVLEDLLADLNRERLAVRVKLTRLTRPQTEQLLAAMFAEAVTSDFLDGIYQETEGNPFFVEEVCKALVEDGKLYRENGRWRRPPMPEIRVPQSVRVAIQSRVTKLPVPAQEALRVAAVLGREFDFATLLHASELAEDVLIDALEAAEHAQLVAETNGRGRESFAFAHALIPATLRESVSGLRRHRLHRRVAAALERVHPDDYEALAHHYSEAGDENQARRYYTQAAERARRVYANADALRCYSEALALTTADPPERFRLLAARAQVYDLVGRRAEQRADVDALLALAETLGDDGYRFEAQLAEAEYAGATDPASALDPAERAAALARSLGDPLREGLALRSLGWAARMRGELKRSQTVLETAAARFREAGQLGEAAACLHTLSLTLSDLTEAAAAQSAIETALALSREAGDRRQEATSLRRLAILVFDQRRFDEMLTLGQSALALHRQMGNRAEEGHDLNVIGLALQGLGRVAEAEANLRESASVAASIESSAGLLNAVTNLVDLKQRQRDYEGALALLSDYDAHRALADNDGVRVRRRRDRAGVLADLGQYAPALELLQGERARAAAVLSSVEQSEVLALIGRCQLEVGDLGAAQATLEAALAQNTEAPAYGRGAALYELSYLARLRSEAAGGDPAGLEAAQAYIDEVVALTRQLNPVRALPYALNYLAELALARGNLAQAQAAAAECLDIAEAHPDEYFLRERFLYTQMRVWRALGRAAEADDCLRRGLAIVNAVTARLQDAARRRSWCENVRVNRALLAEWAARPDLQAASVAEAPAASPNRA